MKIAVLGVGLIGGSIGLAARAKLDAEVAGYDPDRQLLDRALELGAIDSAHDSVASAVEGADLVFCAAPSWRCPASRRRPSTPPGRTARSPTSAR